ncbi:Uncharacterized conserved protein, DUF58 family, contains vWF domain [Microbacterium sp. ru370.1]|uniref:DUF58 domain-containing protein n=1 Tax=unclassified Microbacterium TaxID=2609290 RepID=UPI00087FED1E|nr:MULTISPECIES: DUF58 domain-containing protein [unclassified Microbacterium]SDO52996.1 Uncharacterized conserved protein, DUF58 family, contains vWF domain [Microbacterium sp. ru370.1]SIT84059.1 Uncharacterized conserved protein, DUF58 family, contains vWF domain [Microbacterium sp. RU1D]
MFVTGRLALLVALGVVPLVLLSTAGVPAWIAAGGWVLLCALAMVVDVATAADPRRVEVTRTLPERALRDEPVAGELRVRNLGSRMLRARVRDAWQPTAGAPEQRLRLTVPPGERRGAPLPLLPRRRGELRSAFVVVRATGLLGLAGRQARIDAPGRIRVLPPFTSRRHLPSRLARLRELDGNTTLQVRGQGTEFDSLREYVRGDDVRSIDWRATARAGTTMLRTWRPERDRHVVIVIDTGRTAAARVGDGVRLDAAMEAALLLSVLATRAGDHVHLVMFDRVARARVTRVDGAQLLPALVDAMTPVDPQLIDTDWDAAFAQVRSLSVRPALVVLLTAADDPEAARAFLASLPAVAARSRLLVATATDGPGVVPSHRDAADVYAAAAIERARHDADRVREAVIRAGGDAVAASADDLPPLVADRYLALKAAGRL